MKQSILLIGHGSKDPDGNKEFASLAQEADVHYCLLDYAEPSIPSAFESLNRKGIRAVLVIPYFLFAGKHVQYDIPRLVKEAQNKYPGMRIRVGQHIGGEEALLEVLSDRLGRIKVENQAVLLVGRGSLEAATIVEMDSMTQNFRNRIEHDRVDHCFVAISPPDLPTAIKNCRKKGDSSVVVLPYFLFTGTLVKRIQRISKELGCELRPHLGIHQALIQMLHQRCHEMTDPDSLNSKNQKGAEQA